MHTPTQIRGCRFERLDGNGVLLSGYHRNASVRGSHFAWTGGTAVAGWGRTDETGGDGTRGWDGTGGDCPLGTTVEGNVMRETGIWAKVRAPHAPQAPHALRTRSKKADTPQYTHAALSRISVCVCCWYCCE